MLPPSNGSKIIGNEAGGIPFTDMPAMIGTPAEWMLPNGIAVFSTAGKQTGQEDYERILSVSGHQKMYRLPCL